MTVVLANATLEVHDEGAVNEPPCEGVSKINVIVRIVSTLGQESRAAHHQ